MALLFYASDKQGTGKLLWNLHQDLAAEHQGEFCQTIDTLSQKLHQPKSDSSIAVLLAGTQKELVDILSIGNLLERIRIILILPDSNKDTISKGHTLLPRFLTYVDGNFSWVTAVLEKMLSYNHYVKNTKK